MSQEKVNRYKEEKKNRKANLEKQKKKKRLWKILTPVLILALIALIGAGVYFIPQWTTQYAKDNTEQEVNYDDLIQMLNQAASSQDSTETEETPVNDITDIIGTESMTEENSDQ